MALNRNQKRAIRALLATPTVAQAARRCGLSERTLWRYLAAEEFKAALGTAQDVETRALAASLAGLSSEALRTLHELLTDRSIASGVRVRASLGWLRERRDMIELSELVRRIEALEQQHSG